MLWLYLLWLKDNLANFHACIVKMLVVLQINKMFFTLKIDLLRTVKGFFLEPQMVLFGITEKTNKQKHLEPLFLKV